MLFFIKWLEPQNQQNQDKNLNKAIYQPLRSNEMSREEFFSNFTNPLFHQTLSGRKQSFADTDV